MTRASLVVEMPLLPSLLRGEAGTGSSLIGRQGSATCSSLIGRQRCATEEPLLSEVRTRAHWSGHLTMAPPHHAGVLLIGSLPASGDPCCLDPRRATWRPGTERSQAHPCSPLAVVGVAAI